MAAARKSGVYLAIIGALVAVIAVMTYKLLLAGRTESCACRCHTALDNSLITTPDARDPALMAKLDAVAGRVL